MIQIWSHLVGAFDALVAWARSSEGCTAVGLAKRKCVSFKQRTLLSFHLKNRKQRDLTLCALFCLETTHATKNRAYPATLGDGGENRRTQFFHVVYGKKISRGQDFKVVASESRNQFALDSQYDADGNLVHRIRGALPFVSTPD